MIFGPCSWTHFSFVLYSSPLVAKNEGPVLLEYRWPGESSSWGTGLSLCACIAPSICPSQLTLWIDLLFPHHLASICSFIHSLIHSFTHSLIHSANYWVWPHVRGGSSTYSLSRSDPDSKSWPPLTPLVKFSTFFSSIPKGEKVIGLGYARPRLDGWTFCGPVPVRPDVARGGWWRPGQGRAVQLTPYTFLGPTCVSVSSPYQSMSHSLSLYHDLPWCYKGNTISLSFTWSWACCGQRTTVINSLPLKESTASIRVFPVVENSWSHHVNVTLLVLSLKVKVKRE